ncbi:hypothetical protein JCM8097_009015 [Rhodosporidiobolus ruineniae]
MSSSTSPADLTGPRTDEEVKHDEEGADEVKAPSPFDRLPDEVVVEILRQAFGDSSTWFKPVLPKTTVLGKRLHYLTQQVWLERHDRAPRYEGLMVGLFPNLTTVHAALATSEEEDDPDEPVPLPNTFTESLRLLRNLRELDIQPGQSWQLEAPSFSIARDLPNLSSLSLDPGCTCLRQLLASQPSLKHLQLAPRPDPSSCQLIPWTTLKTLSLNLSRSDYADAFESDSNSGSEAETGTVVEQVNKSLQAALFPSSELDFHYSAALLDLPHLSQLPTVLGLTLYGQQHWSASAVVTTNHLPSIHRFLSAFPSP